MPGSKAGGIKAAKTNKAKYGDDFFRKIGSLGGRATGPKGFAANPKLAVKAGRKGGLKSRRTGVTTGEGQKKEYYYNGDGKFNTDKSKPVKEFNFENAIEALPDEYEPPKPPKKSFINRIFGGK